MDLTKLLSKIKDDKEILVYLQIYISWLTFIFHITTLLSPLILLKPHCAAGVIQFNLCGSEGIVVDFDFVDLAVIKITGTGIFI